MFGGTATVDFKAEAVRVRINEVTRRGECPFLRDVGYANGEIQVDTNGQTYRHSG